MNKQQRHKAALRVAVRVIGLTKFEDVTSGSRRPEVKATRTLFTALCRHFHAKGSPVTYGEIATVFGRVAVSGNRISQLLRGEPGLATTEVARAWHAGMAGERVKVKHDTVVQAVREVAGDELANEIE